MNIYVQQDRYILQNLGDYEYKNTGFIPRDGLLEA